MSIWRQAAVLLAAPLLTAACAGGGGEAPVQIAIATTATAATTSTVEAAATVAELEQIAADEFGGDANVAQLRVPAGWEPLWLVASGAPDVVGEGAVALFRADGTLWVELARMQLDEWSSAQQVEVTPNRVWLQIGDSGEVSRGFRLLSFDGSELVARFAVRPTSMPEVPPMRGVRDYDGDGLLDVVVDASERLLCDECFVERVAEILRWDGGSLTPARLERLPDGAPEELRAQVDRVVELAEAGLWRHAALAIADARTGGAGPFESIVTWNAVLIDLRVTEYEGDSGRQGVPLLVPLVAGDHEAVVDLLRGFTAEELFAEASPLLRGTPAEGLDAALGDLLVERAAAALKVHPQLAAAYFVRALGRYLIDSSDVVTVRADVRQAEGLEPYDEFYAIMAVFLHAIPAPAPGR